MIHHSLLRLALLPLLAAGAIAVRGATTAATEQRPNFLIFITDDESWQERSAYGWSNLPTPHFDRIAREGALFTRGYTSAPSCAPSRAALLTGRNFWELEQGAFIQAWLPEKFARLPDLLAARGYHAGYTGKGWGPGVPPPNGSRRNPAGEVYNAVKRKERLPGISDIDYAANLERFLAKRPKDAPFWFWVGCIEPHSPCAPDNHVRLKEQYGLGPEDVRVPGFLPDTPGIRRHRANMLYEVCHADKDLGRILDVLTAKGLLDNTLVVVTGDNGTQVLRSKTNLYDWGVHVPLAMLWPARIKPGRRIDDFVNFIDIAPTMLQAAGIERPRDMTGRSLLDLLRSGASGRIDPERGWTTAGLEWHGESDPSSWAARMIRSERYLYIVNYSDQPRRVLPADRRLADSAYDATASTGSEVELITRHPEHPKVKRYVELFAAARPREELYDSETDPWQLQNLANSPAHAAIKADLKARLEEYQRRTGDPRATGKMEIFEATRAFVLQRKFGPGGYAEK